MECVPKTNCRFLGIAMRRDRLLCGWVFRCVANSIAIVLVCLVALTGCRQSADTDRTILVFAAASLSEALTEIGALFEDETGSRVVFNFAGSQVLAQQIVASGRGDLFISADDAWMDFVEAKGQVEEKSRRTLIANRLAVVCAADAEFELDRPEDLTALDFKYLCIGNPDTVPAGRYAKAWLESVDLWEGVHARVSPATNVRAALEQAISRTDAIGIVYRTEFARAGDRAKLLWEMPESVVRYPMALLEEGEDHDIAGQFYEYLQSESAKRVFEAYGFEVL